MIISTSRRIDIPAFYVIGTPRSLDLKLPSIDAAVKTCQELADWFGASDLAL